MNRANSGTYRENGYTVFENASLQGRNTFHVAARAALLIDVDESAVLPELFAMPAVRGGPLLVLGGGSNLLFTADFNGVVLSLKNRAVRKLEECSNTTLIRAGAGENWNDFVHWSLAQGLRGLENLVLIPGSVGAAPIQNIGAYGVEACEFVETVEAFDRYSGETVRLDNQTCRFAYRDSVFKHDPDRYIISAVEFALPKKRDLRTGYAGIREELASMHIDEVTPAAVAEAVIRLRTRKLPDPAVLGNAGSFFKNPIVDSATAADLCREHAGLPVWPVAPDQSKLSAAWLVEACGLKGQRNGDAGVAEKHALVLVNHGSASGTQIVALARRIRKAVRSRFGIDLQPEPLIFDANGPVAL